MADEYKPYYLEDAQAPDKIIDTGSSLILQTGSLSSPNDLWNLSATTDKAVFKAVSIGGTTQQYIVSDNGAYSFGDGSDGAYTFSNQGTAPTGTTKTDNTNGATIFTIDRDVYTTTLTIDATVTVKTNGYRIFSSVGTYVKGTLDRKGNDGANASSSVGGAGGDGLSDGYLKGVGAGGAGGNGTTATTPGNGNPGAGGAGGNKTNSIGVNGSVGGASADGTAGGTNTTVTASNVKLIANWHLNTLLDVSSSGSTVKFDGSGSSGGGAGATTNNSGVSGAGGGGGASAGGILAVYSKEVVVSLGGTITAVGGAGGTGGNGSPGNALSGGGGGGGAGGNVIIVYNSLVNEGTITAAGGAGGAGGTGNGTGVSGDDGIDGYVRLFQVSL